MTTLGEIGIGDNQLLDLLNVVARHRLVIGELVGFEVGLTGAKQVAHDAGVEAGGLEVVTSSYPGCALR